MCYHYNIVLVPSSSSDFGCLSPILSIQRPQLSEALSVCRVFALMPQRPKGGMLVTCVGCPANPRQLRWGRAWSWPSRWTNIHRSLYQMCLIKERSLLEVVFTTRVSLRNFSSTPSRQRHCGHVRQGTVNPFVETMFYVCVPVHKIETYYYENNNEPTRVSSSSSGSQSAHILFSDCPMVLFSYFNFQLFIVPVIAGKFGLLPRVES